jgi:aminopeptidase N
MRRTTPVNALFAAYLAVAATAGAQEPVLEHVDEELGVVVRLPDASWTLHDQSQGAAIVRVFSPEEDLSLRCSLLRLPVTLLPEGLLTREEQIRSVAGDAYERLEHGPCELAGRDAEQLRYRVGPGTALERAVIVGEWVLVFQVAAPSASWEDEEDRAVLEALIASFRFVGEGRVREVGVDPSTPAEVRARRRAALPGRARAFEVEHHDLAARIEPASGRLEVVDRLRVRSRSDGLRLLELAFSGVEMRAVHTAEGDALEWSTVAGSPAGLPHTLVISLPAPLDGGEELELVVEAAREELLETVDQALIAEIEVVGQVRERSSFSSHVLYYPIDAANDASVELALTVPAGYSAVTGGELVGVDEADGWSTFRYREELRVPRQLPFGFAVARYVSETATTAGGLRLTVHGYPGEEELVRQRLAVAVEAAHVFERAMGELPWRDVRFAHVTPIRKEMGVSLPGLVLLSDTFFGDLAGEDLSDGDLDSARSAGTLLVADELSHQWNFYASGWPNELAEGVSTFTNCLFVEERHGRDAYRAALRTCRDAYRASVLIGDDVAIADPRVYETAAYRGIVFCKTPVVLDMLRTELGDERFFTAWREAFRSGAANVDGFERLRETFSRRAGRDLGPFFDQWFFRAGAPRVDVSLEWSDGVARVTLTQAQSGEPYSLAGDLLLRGANERTLRARFVLDGTETEVRAPCEFEPVEVVLDPDGLLLVEQVSAKAPQQDDEHR